MASSTLPIGLRQRCQCFVFGSSVPPGENFQVAVIREKPMPLFPDRLTNHAELHYVLQSLRHSRRRKRELFGCCGDCDDRLALKV
jgi:hypothetical protein